MPNSISSTTLENFTTFGDLLRFLRRRVGLTQTDLSVAVGYSESQISRLEQNQRLPDPPMVEARFVPALYLEEEPEAIARLLELAMTVKREDAPATGMCPYKGLDYFDEADADLFFGREALTEKLTMQVLALVSSKKPPRIRFFTIVGASGSGKSSLVRAGLVPALQWNKSSANWTIYILTPTAHPIENLVAALLKENATFATASTLMDDLRADPRALGYYIRRELVDNTSPYCLLIIDQFEELFSLCRSEEERDIYINILLTAAAELDGQVIVVITLRADFYTSCASYQGLREVLSTHQEYIGSMSSSEMRLAIEQPAQHGNWEFEPGLVDLIQRDVGRDPGALPLLSHALLETWERRHARKMTLGGYISTGGVRGAIAETAEAVFTDQLTPGQQAIARRIFLRLTELGDGSEVGETRRRVTYNELILKPDDAESTRYILKVLVDARLLTASENTVEVTHEALIREWPTLRGWLEENRESLHLHRQLTHAAQEWDSTDRQPDLLFRGARLAQAREWAATNSDDLNPLERDFLADSVSLSEQEIAARAAQQQRELQAAQKLADTERQRAEESTKSAQRLKRFIFLLGGVGALVVILAVFAVLAWQQSVAHAAAIRSTSLAGAAEQVNQTGQGDLALALAIEAARGSSPPLKSVEALRSVALGPGTRKLINSNSHEIRALALSPNGTMAVTGSCATKDVMNYACITGELVLWDIKSGNEIRRWAADSGWVDEVVFSSDGQYVVSAGDRDLQVGSINGKLVRTLSGNGTKITQLVRVPGTNQVLSGRSDGYLFLYDLSTSKLVRRFQISAWPFGTGGYAADRPPVTALAVSSNGRTAISAYQDGSIWEWDLSGVKPPHYVPGSSREIRAIALSTDASWFLYTDSMIANDISLRKANTADGIVLSELKLDCLPSQIVLNPDDSKVFITCSSTIIQVDIPSWTIQQRYAGNGEVFKAFSLSPDGQFGLSGAADGSLREWNLYNQVDYQVDLVDANPLNSIAISSEGRYLVLNDNSNYELEGPALWDIHQNALVKNYPGGWLDFVKVAVSPDSRYIAAIGVDSPHQSDRSQVVQWNADTEKYVYLGYEFIGNPTDIAYSPDGRYLLIGTQVPGEPRGELLLYNVQTSKEEKVFETSEDVSSIAFSADGTRALSGSSLLGRVILWDLGTGKEIRRYSYSYNGPISAVAFGPGDKTVLGAGLGEIYAWDTNTGRLVQLYTGLTTSPMSLAVSPDGKYVLSGTVNGELILWECSTGEQLNRIDTHVAISSVVFSPDSKIAYASARQGKLIKLAVDEKSLSELLDWIKVNRYVRELTCTEKLVYHLVPSCDQR